MKKIVSYICGAVMVISMISCTGALESEIEDLKSRVSDLESVQNKLSITGLEEYDNGYRISFLDGKVFTIKGQNPVRIPVSNNDNPKIIRILPTYSDESVKLGFSKNI